MANEEQVRSEESQLQLECLEDLVECRNSQQTNPDGIAGLQKRGMTKGLSVERRRRKTEKLTVTIHPLRKRVVGDHAKDFITEICVILKQHVPLQYTRWKDVPAEIKKKIWFALKQKFNLQEDLQAKKAVDQQLNRQYRNRRYNLHAYYLKNKDDEDKMNQPPEGVSQGDWEQLVNYFESAEFKAVSNRNKENRKNLVMAHVCGTKSIAQRCYEERDNETEEEPTRTSSWRLTRYSTKKDRWVDQASKEVYEDLTKMQSEPTEGGQDPLTEDEAFIKRLGPERSSRLRGCGDGLKPPSKRGHGVSAELETENEELTKKAEEARETQESLKKKNDELALRLEVLESQLNNQESQVHSQVEAILKSQLPSIIQSISVPGRIQPSTK